MFRLRARARQHVHVHTQYTCTFWQKCHHFKNLREAIKSLKATINNSRKIDPSNWMTLQYRSELREYRTSVFNKPPTRKNGTCVFANTLGPHVYAKRISLCY